MMGEAGIAEVVEAAIQHEAGLPTKYELTRPKYLLFVDEMGCNTNQLNDGKVGEELFIMPKTKVMLQHQPGQPPTSTLQCHPLHQEPESL
jgi:hypothetical protein